MKELSLLFASEPESEPVSTQPAARDSTQNTSDEEPIEVPWYIDAESRQFRALTRFAIFSAAALFGALGATLSLLTRPKSTRVLLSVARLIGHQFVGASFAVLLTLFFVGRLIAGSLFPESIYNESWFSVIYVHREFAKLLVWSFLAGFSERLVPHILETFVDRIQQDVAHPDKNNRNAS